MPGIQLKENPDKEKSWHRKNQDSKSARHQKAAYEKNEPASKFKRKCVLYYEVQKELNPKLSYTQAARDFVEEQGQEELKKSTLVPTNAVRTLAEALGKYYRGEKEPWMEKLKEFLKQSDHN